MQKVSVRDVLARAERFPQQGGRSPLYRWMREHHDELATRFALERPSWSALAATFGECKLTDRTGKPPSPETARKTWQRVRKDSARRERVSFNMRPSPLPEVRFVQPDADRPTQGRYEFRPASRRVHAADPGRPRMPELL